MKKLLIFSTMMLTVSMAHAGDGSYTGGNSTSEA